MIYINCNSAELLAKDFLAVLDHDALVVVAHWLAHEVVALGVLWLVKGEGIGIIGGVDGNRKSLLGQARKRFSSLCKENIEVTGVLILVLACFLVLLEEFLLNIARNEFVASELH